ncbi:MAG TPA: flavin reductase family protein [Micromonosporaceae bacterium]|nr:flavin reductase family protein [Micromonosporaceae bacterium]
MNGAELASVDFDAFRTIMGSFASGVSVVTTLGDDEAPRGMTCSAVCSVSADPPLLLSCVKPPSSTLNAIRTRGLFAVNFLDADGRELSDLFASQTPDKFAQVGWRPGATAGMPVLGPTLAYAECTVHNMFDAGDHVVVIGRIIGGQVAADRFPLAYWRGRYVRVFRVANGGNGRRPATQEPTT